MFDAHSNFPSIRLGFFDYAKQRLVIGSSSSKIPRCLVRSPPVGMTSLVLSLKLLGNKELPYDRLNENSQESVPQVFWTLLHVLSSH